MRTVRIGSVLAGCALIGLAAWLVLAWVDSAAGYDATCENAVRFWIDEARRDSCQTHMSLRTLVAVAFTLVGAGYLVSAIAPSAGLGLRVLHSRPFISAVGLATALALIWNEITRSGGLWAQP